MIKIQETGGGPRRSSVKVIRSLGPRDWWESFERHLNACPIINLGSVEAREGLGLTGGINMKSRDHQGDRSG
jgi:hypothetical protein